MHIGLGAMQDSPNELVAVCELDGAIFSLASVLPGLHGGTNQPDILQTVLPGLQDRLLQPSASLQSILAEAARVEQQQLIWKPPIQQPQKILCVGLNYADHARETGKTPPAEPLIFSKLNTTLRGHESPIVLPTVSDQVDFEAELVVVIGKTGRDILRTEAMDYVAGYMCGHDVSARDWQKGKPGGQWLLGKSFDSFAPTGPWFVTGDQVDPTDLAISLRLNGEVMQDSRTSQLLFPVDELIAYISQVCTLEPGDLIFTGTPAGVGFARDPQVFLKPGDTVEVEIEGLGVLRNHVID